MTLPSIAIIGGMYNPDLRVFEDSLDSVVKQRYRGRVVQYLLDGGSTNGAIGLAKRYKCRLFFFANDADEGGSRLFPVLSGINEDLILLMESDNILPDTDWLKRMVEPFSEPEVFSTFSLHNTFRCHDDILTKYFALLGSPDPTLYYLHKSDKVRMDQTQYDKGQILMETRAFFVVKFAPDDQPVMGDNGFMIRTRIFKSVVRKGHPFYHTDAYAQLLARGYDTVGVVKNAIIHVSRSNIIHQVKRRVEVKVHFTDAMRGRRTYLVFNPRSWKDRWNLMKYIVYTVTFIEPLWLSIRGYVLIQEPAWFLHPIMCWCMLIGYGWSEILMYIKKIRRVCISR